jgi:hypothetical protein
MNKTIKVSNLIYEMLVLIAKKANKKPEDFIEHIIQENHSKMKK